MDYCEKFSLNIDKRNLKMNLKYCVKCVMPNTRPRITFNKDGICNACQWADEKKTAIDWDNRWNMLKMYCEKYRSRTDGFDVIVPVSGGKDSCYVAWKMKYELNMNPLLVHVAPPLPMEIGEKNLERLIAEGFDCVRVHPNPNISRKIALIEMHDFGDPLLAWMISVRSAVFRQAIKFNIPLIMWGEDGDIEYGGLTTMKFTPIHDRNYELNINLSGNNPNKYLDYFSKSQLYFWLFPSQEEYDSVGIANMHFNFFDAWDQYRNYTLAKEKFDFGEVKDKNIGTYTNFSQTDSAMFDLHCYFMYLKFGFGRCTADACIDIRRGAMDRVQAINLIKKFDNGYPEPFIEKYLHYFQIDMSELQIAIDKHANKNLFEKINGYWTPIFEVA